MFNRSKKGLIKRQELSAAELAQVEQLADICNSYENLDMRINWIKLRPRYFWGAHDYLYYEDGRLVGYLFLKRYGTTRRELMGMVHPEYRCRGIFTRLLTTAMQECKRQGVQRLVLTCEQSSQSGQAFITAIGARYDFSGYKMLLETFQERFAYDDRLAFQRADESDLSALVMIITDGTARNAEAVRESLLFNLQEPHCQVYIARFGGNELTCGEPLGCLRIYDLGNETGIYGFVVRPEYRGRGYGRQMLEEVIRAIKAYSQKPIMLEVDTTNTVAINLYRSCGFEAQRTYDYYYLDL